MSWLTSLGFNVFFGFIGLLFIFVVFKISLSLLVTLFGGIFSRVHLPTQKWARIALGIVAYLTITQILAKAFQKTGYYDDIKVTLWTVLFIVLFIAFCYRKEVKVLDKIFSFLRRVLNINKGIGFRTSYWVIGIIILICFAFIILAFLSPQISSWVLSLKG